MTYRATPAAVRPDHDPLADPDWQEPEPPRRRLSWTRLGILVLVLGLAGAGGTLEVMHLRDTAGPTAKSWAVPYVDVTLTPTFPFQDPTANPANDVALGFVVADPKNACRPAGEIRVSIRAGPSPTRRAACGTPLGMTRNEPGSATVSASSTQTTSRPDRT